MKTTITTAQAMSHPDVALTINTLGAMADELRAERDALALGVDQWRVDFHELRIERNELQETITAMCNAIPNYDWSGDSAEKIADLVKERDALRDAARQALDALQKSSDYLWDTGADDARETAASYYSAKGRTMSKPHIRKEQPFGRKIYIWACRGRGATGIGYTVRQAYSNWQHFTSQGVGL